MRLLNIWGICTLFLVGCAKPQHETDVIRIDLNSCEEREVLTSEIFDDVECIKLETRKGCMLSNFRGLSIVDTSIFISDAIKERVLVFGLDGSYKRQLYARGKGAGEYSEITDFIVDPNDSTIEILDQLVQKIHIYRLSDFSYIRSIPFSFIFGFRFVKVDGLYYFQTNSSHNIVNGSPTNSEIIILNPQTGEEQPIFDYVRPSDQNQTWDFNQYFSKTQNGVYVSMAWHNTIYRIAEGKVCPAFLVDAGSRAFPRTVINGTYDDKMAYMQSSEAYDKFHAFGLVASGANSYILVYSTLFPKYKLHYFICIGETNIQASAIIGDFFPLNGSKINLYRESGGLVYSLVNPSDIDAKQAESMSVSQNDNPTLLLFKLKDKL